MNKKSNHFKDFHHGELVPYVHMHVLQSTSKVSLVVDSVGMPAKLMSEQLPDQTFKATNVVVSKTDDFSLGITISPTPATIWTKTKKTFKTTNVDFQAASEALSRKTTNLRGLVITRTEEEDHVALKVLERKNHFFTVRVPKGTTIPDRAEFLFVSRSHRFPAFWPTEFTKVRSDHDGSLQNLNPEALEVINSEQLKKVGFNELVRWKAMVTTVKEPYFYKASPEPNSPRKVRETENGWEEISTGKIHSSFRKYLKLAMTLSCEGVTVEGVCFDKSAVAIFELPPNIVEDVEHLKKIVEEEILFHEAIFTLRKNSPFNGKDQFLIVEKENWLTQEN